MTDGKIAALMLRVDQPEFAKAMQVLTAKYGKPTNSTTSEVSTRAGAKLTSLLAVWSGKRVQITAVERVGRIDASYIDFLDTALSDQEAERKDRDVKSKASKL